MLNKNQEEELINFVANATYTENYGYVFGPGLKRSFSSLYDILNEINVGYFSSYADPKTTTNDDKALIIVYALYSQSDKILAALGRLPLPSPVEESSSLKITAEEADDSSEKVTKSKGYSSGLNILGIPTKLS